MTTFSDLGIPFPLYEAPIDTCSEYAWEQFCCVSGEKREHCFRMGSGSYVRTDCPSCGGVLFLSPMDDRFRPKECRLCGKATPKPIAQKDEAFVSYEALRNGDAIITKDTDYGMISWEQLESGWSHGIPGARFGDLETRTNDEGWVQVKLSVPLVAELLRTPGFVTWQGDRWLFRGTQPMIYVGEWKRKDFESHCPSSIDPRDFFLQTVQDANSELWESADGVCIYVFRDPSDGTFKAYYDMD